MVKPELTASEACHRLASREGQKENKTMGIKGKPKAVRIDLKLAFLVLLIATTVWGIVFYFTFQDYQEYLEECRHSNLSEWGLANPYWEWNDGIYVVVTGEFLLLGWLTFLWKLLSTKVYPHMRAR
jgi:hypothetical protein